MCSINARAHPATRDAFPSLYSGIARDPFSIGPVCSDLKFVPSQAVLLNCSLFFRSPTPIEIINIKV